MKNPFEIHLFTEIYRQIIFKFLSRIYKHRPKAATVPKKKLRIFVSCLGNISNITKSKLTETVKKKLEILTASILSPKNKQSQELFLS